MSCAADESAGEIEHAKEAICVVGLGTVGLSLGVALAAAGLRVIGVDRNTQLIDDLINGRTYHYDPNLTSAIFATAGRLCFAASLPQPGVAAIYILAVGTPIDAEHALDGDQLDAAISALITRLRPGDLVIMRSTVPIGTTRVVSDRVSGTVGDVDFACCPDRSLTGDTFREIHRLPQIVGGTTPHALARAAELFARLGVEIVAVDSVETAEAVKLIGNVQRDVLFAISNEIAMMCDGSGLDAHHVIESSRRGYPRHVLPPPGPVGGPCLTKDAFLYAEGLKPYGVRPKLALDAREVNASVATHAAAFIARHAATVMTPIVAVLGISFKGRPETSMVDASLAGKLRLELGALLPQAVFRGWDPVAQSDAVASLGFLPCETAMAAVGDSNVVVLANDHPAVTALPLTALASTLGRPALIYDLWGPARGVGCALPDGVLFQAFGSHHGRAGLDGFQGRGALAPPIQS
jgi:UDP-N-acetyl-D-mannosaminuronic acid dehydrogenase